MCNKGLNEAFGENFFNFMLLSFGYLVILKELGFFDMVYLLATFPRVPDLMSFD